MQLKLEMNYFKETKNCYCFECGDKDAGTYMTVYFKKSDIEAAGINAKNGVVLTVEGRKA